MQLPKKIEPDHLIETLVELRMDPACDLRQRKDDIRGLMQTLGYKAYPAPSIVVKRGGSSEELAVGAIFTHNCVRVILQSDRLSFNCALQHYLGWDAYRSRIREVAKLLLDNGITKQFNRAQMRYISEFEQLDILGRINLSLSCKGPTYAMQDLNLRRDDQGCTIFVSLSGLRKRRTANRQEKTSSLFDVCVLKALTPPTSSVDDLCQALDEAHTCEKETFFSLLTPDFLTSLNPQY